MDEADPFFGGILADVQGGTRRHRPGHATTIDENSPTPSAMAPTIGLSHGGVGWGARGVSEKGESSKLRSVPTLSLRGWLGYGSRPTRVTLRECNSSQPCRRRHWRRRRPRVHELAEKRCDAVLASHVVAASRAAARWIGAETRRGVTRARSLRVDWRLRPSHRRHRRVLRAAGIRGRGGASTREVPHDDGRGDEEGRR